MTGPPGPRPVASIQVAPGADTLLALGRTRTYTAVARAADGTAIPDAPIRWRSSDTLVARVDSLTGVVTAVRNGLATISALSGAATGTGTVSVIQLVATVLVSPAAVNVDAIGGTQAFSAEARDSANAVVPGVRFLWTSSNPAVATIDSLGAARVAGAGETVISASGRGVPAFARLAVTQTAARLVFTIEPTTISAGGSFATALQVEVRDANDALVKDARVPVTLELVTYTSVAQLGGTTTVNTAGGIANFSGNTLTYAAPSYRVRATSPGLSPDTSVAFVVRSAAPARLTFESLPPTPAVGGYWTPGTIDVRVWDTFGNAVDTSVAMGITAAASPGTVGGGIRMLGTQRMGGGINRVLGVWFTRPGPSVELTAEAYFPERTLYSTPAVVRPVADLSSVSLANIHACGVSSGGVLCWGNNGAGSLGVSGIESDSVPRLAGLPYTSTQLTQVSVNGFRTCALDVAGTAFCWGNGPSGAVTGTGAGGVALTSIATGNGHACGLTAGGAAWCWGTGTSGQLGNGTNTANAATPVQVSGSGAGLLVFSQLVTGDTHTCALGVGGRAYCWGFNGDGRVGDSTLVSRNVPTLVAGTGAGARVMTSVMANGGLSCGTTVEGRGLCWGRNPRTFAGQTSSVPLVTFDIAVGVAFTAIAPGRAHVCALSGGLVYCVGENAVGQVGPTAAELEGLPRMVPMNGRTVTRIWAGESSSCALAGGSVYCWGENSNGMLGIGSSEAQIVRNPTRVVH